MLSPDAPKATRREWMGLAVIALPCILYAMDLSILNLAVPSLTADLKPTAAQLLWIVDIYGFFVAASLLTMGTFGDRIGRRKLLLIGAAAFAVVSAFAAFSRSAEMLISARAVLGVAGATLAPSTLSLISNMFPRERERTFAVSVWIASFSLGGGLGPIVGGVILAHFWWGAVLLVPVPIMVLLLVLGPILLPEYKNPNAGPLDLRSAALSVATVLPIVYGIKLAAEGDSLLWAGVAIVVGLGFGTVFIRRQMSLADPLLDLRLFRVPSLTAALLVNMFDFFVGFGVFLLVAQYLQLVLGLSPLEAGLWGLPSALGFIVGSFLTSPLLRLMRPAYVLGLGLGVGAAGLVVMAQLWGAHSLYFLVGGNALLAIGTAPCAAIAADLVVSAAPPERAGSASALNETSSEFGGALGIALLGSLATFLYRSALGTKLPLSFTADQADMALRGIGDATSLGRTLPDQGAALLRAARTAYTSAISVGFLSGAAIVALAAIASGEPATQHVQLPVGTDLAHGGLNRHARDGAVCPLRPPCPML